MPYRTLAGLFKKEPTQADKKELLIQKILSCPIDPNEYYYTSLGTTSKSGYQLKTLDVWVTTSGQLFCATHSRHPIFILKDRRLKKFAKKIEKDYTLRLKERLKREIEQDKHETAFRKESEQGKMKLNWEYDTHDFHYLNLFENELRIIVWRRNDKENYFVELNDCPLTHITFKTKEEAMKVAEEWLLNQINQIMEPK